MARFPRVEILEYSPELRPDFERLNPSLRVEVVGGATDDRMQAALDGEDPPSVVSSFESDSFGRSHSVTRLVDLGPYLARDVLRRGVRTWRCGWRGV